MLSLHTRGPCSAEDVDALCDTRSTTVRRLPHAGAGAHIGHPTPAAHFFIAFIAGAAFIAFATAFTAFIAFIAGAAFIAFATGFTAFIAFIAGAAFIAFAEALTVFIAFIAFIAFAMTRGERMRKIEECTDRESNP